MAAHRLADRRPDHHIHGVRQNRMHPRARHHRDLVSLLFASVLGAVLSTGLIVVVAAGQVADQPVRTELAAVTRCEPATQPGVAPGIPISYVVAEG